MSPRRRGNPLHARRPSDAMTFMTVCERPMKRLRVYTISTFLQRRERMLEGVTEEIFCGRCVAGIAHDPQVLQALSGQSKREVTSATCVDCGETYSKGDGVAVYVINGENVCELCREERDERRQG